MKFYEQKFGDGKKEFIKYDWKKGDLLFSENGNITLKIIERLGDLVWTCEVFPKTKDIPVSYSPPSCAQEIDDLITFGFIKI